MIAQITYVLLGNHNQCTYFSYFIIIIINCSFCSILVSSIDHRK